MCRSLLHVHCFFINNSLRKPKREERKGKKSFLQGEISSRNHQLTNVAQFFGTLVRIYIYKKGKIHSGAIFIGFDSFQPLSPFELENNRRLMLRPPRLLKRITAFNNPTFAKISQRSRITFAAANQRARSHCFADHLFLPGVTFAKMEARYYGSPHCFRGKR